MALEVNKFTLAGNDIEVVDQYARDKIEEIIHTEVTKTYVDAGDAALQSQINGLPTKTYVDNADSNLQTAINGKQATITGAATTITSDDLTASKALISNSNGKVAVSDTTATELGYVHGVTSNIQSQIRLLNTIASALQQDVINIKAWENEQYYEVKTEFFTFYIICFGIIKVAFFRDEIIKTIPTGWSDIKNAAETESYVLPNKYKPIMGTAITSIFQGGARLTMQFKTDGLMSLYAGTTISAGTLTRTNFIYV